MPSRSLSTPIGPVTVIVEAGLIRALRIGTTEPHATDAADPLLTEALAQLRDWFARARTQFDLPLAPARTPRGAALRAAIGAVPAGSTASYGAVARAAGSSPRAVGQACARNPFPIVVPCHRIVGAAGTPGHYSAGEGLATKRWLLKHEGSDFSDG